MGNSLNRPTLGAVTPNFPHVLTDQVVNKPLKPKPNRITATTVTDETNNTLYYAVIVLAVIYFWKRG